MNPNLAQLIKTILRLGNEGQLKPSNLNDGACLRHLVLYLSQRNASDREKLLEILQNVAIETLGLPFNEQAIRRETKINFRKLLLPQQLGTTTESEIDELYEAIVKSEI